MTTGTSSVRTVPVLPSPVSLVPWSNSSRGSAAGSAFPGEVSHPLPLDLPSPYPSIRFFLLFCLLFLLLYYILFISIKLISLKAYKANRHKIKFLVSCLSHSLLFYSLLYFSSFTIINPFSQSFYVPLFFPSITSSTT